MTFKTLALALTAVAATLATAAVAQPNLVSNGSLESSIYSVNHEFGVDFGGQGVTDWTATLPGGISFYIFPTTASTVSPINRFGDGNAELAASYTGASPDGGNFVGFDSDQVGDGAGKYNSPFDQTITGLTVGQVYALKFYWAGTQLQNRHGATTAQMTATFGGVTQTTGAPIVVADQGFTGWMTVNWNFTATSTTDTLSFLAFGTPAGAPPFALLDGISLTAVPEPATWALMIGGLGLTGVALRRRRAVAA